MGYSYLYRLLYKGYPVLKLKEAGIKIFSYIYFIGMNSKNYDNYLRLLENYRIKKGDPYNFLSVSTKYGGSYFVPVEYHRAFIRAYIKARFEDSTWENHYNYFCLSEQHDPEGLEPFILDIDLKVKFNPKEEKETDHIWDAEKHIMPIITKLCKLFNEMYDIKDEEIFFFRKDSPDIKTQKIPKTNEEYSLKKDGLHIEAPNLIMDIKTRYYVRDMMYKFAFPDGKESLFADIELIEQPDKILDQDVVEKNGWMLYGCHKDGSSPYVLSKIFKIKDEGKSTIPRKKYAEKDLVKLLTIQGKGSNGATPLKSDLIEEAIKDNYSRRTTGRKNKKKFDVKVGDSTKKGSVDINSISLPINDIHEEKLSLTKDNIAKMQKIVMGLDKKRSDDEGDWMKVGWCLHNIGKGGEEMMNIWIEFSQQSDKFEEGICEEKWSKMRTEGYGEGSLYYWLREDNLPLWESIMQDDVVHQIIRFSRKKFQTADVAEIAKKFFKNDYVCADISNNLWYHFTEHRWRENRGGTDLLRDFGTRFYKYFLEAEKRINEKIQKLMDTGDADDDENSAQMSSQERYKKNIAEISSKLRDISYKKKLLAECALVFEDAQFMEKLDNKHHLIGFEDCIMDLEEGIYRDGKPDDYVSLSVGYKHWQYDPDDPDVQLIEEFFRKIHKELAMREYVLDKLSEFIQGNYGDEKMYIWYGKGRNGKSKIVELMDKALGDYSGILPSQVLTQKKPLSNSANPDIAKTKGKRFVAANEADTDDKFNLGVMKELTGGDKVQARMLHQNPFEFRPQFHLVYLVNVLPEVRSQDDGTWDRIRVVPHGTRFTTNPKLPHEELLDSDLRLKLAQWGPKFMAMLIQRHVDNRKNKKKIADPPQVVQYTREYKELSDTYKQFIEARLEYGPEFAEISFEDIYGEFKDWYKLTQASNRLCPNLADVREYFRKHHPDDYSVVSRALKHYRIKLVV
jgi:P4 family phage/plasmid primase-like protien